MIYLFFRSPLLQQIYNAFNLHQSLSSLFKCLICCRAQLQFSLCCCLNSPARLCPIACLLGWRARGGAAAPGRGTDGGAEASRHHCPRRGPCARGGDGFGSGHERAAFEPGLAKLHGFVCKCPESCQLSQGLLGLALGVLTFGVSELNRGRAGALPSAVRAVPRFRAGIADGPVQSHRSNPPLNTAMAPLGPPARQARAGAASRAPFWSARGQHGVCSGWRGEAACFLHSTGKCFLHTPGKAAGLARGEENGVSCLMRGASWGQQVLPAFPAAATASPAALATAMGTLERLPAGLPLPSWGQFPVPHLRLLSAQPQQPLGDAAGGGSAGKGCFWGAWGVLILGGGGRYGWGSVKPWGEAPPCLSGACGPLGIAFACGCVAAEGGASLARECV